MSEENIFTQPTYYWFASLIEYYDFDSFEISELGTWYNVNPYQVPIYQEFDNIIQNERKKKLKK